MLGEAPLRSKGTLNEMLTAGAADDGGWWAKILSVHQNEVYYIISSSMSTNCSSNSPSIVLYAEPCILK